MQNSSWRHEDQQYGGLAPPPYARGASGSAPPLLPGDSATTMEIRLPGSSPKQIYWYPGTTVADISDLIKAQLGLPPDAVFSLRDPDDRMVALSPRLPNGLSFVVDVMVPSVDNNTGGWQATVINSPGACGIVGCGNVMTGRTVIQAPGASIDQSDHSVRMSQMLNKEKKVTVGARVLCRGDTTSATGGNAIARTAAETDMSKGHQGISQDLRSWDHSKEKTTDFSRRTLTSREEHRDDHSQGSHHKDSHNRARDQAKIGGHNAHNVSDSHNELGEQATMKHHSTDVNVDTKVDCVIM